MFAIILSLFIVSCAPKKPVKPQNAQEKMMIQTGQKYFKALKNHDMASVREVIADDYESKQELFSYLQNKFEEWKNDVVDLAKYKPVKINGNKVVFYTLWRHPRGQKPVDVALVMESKKGTYKIVDIPH